MKRLFLLSWFEQGGSLERIFLAKSEKLEKWTKKLFKLLCLPRASLGSRRGAVQDQRWNAHAFIHKICKAKSYFHMASEYVPRRHASLMYCSWGEILESILIFNLNTALHFQISKMQWRRKRRWRDYFCSPDMNKVVAWRGYFQQKVKSWRNALRN